MRMKQNRTSYPMFQMGTALLLVVLTSLCLIVFAALSLSSALRDYGYSEKIAEKTKAYYEADSKANLELKALVETGNTGIHTFEVPINETRILSVKVALTEEDYHILEWKEVSSTTWEQDDTLPVLGSDQED